MLRLLKAKLARVSFCNLIIYSHLVRVGVIVFSSGLFALIGGVPMHVRDVCQARLMHRECVSKCWVQEAHPRYLDYTCAA